MPTGQDLIRQMEHLSLEQLEIFHGFIKSRPYKLEGRAPTREEFLEVWDELQRLLSMPNTEDDDAAARLEALMRKNQ